MRCFSYQRQQETEWRKFRKVAFYSMVGSHLDHKKIPNNEVKFFPIGDEIAFQSVTEEHKEKYLKAFAKYQEQVKKNKLKWQN